MHFDIKRYNGQISFQRSPFCAFTDEAQIAEVIRGMTEDGPWSPTITPSSSPQRCDRSGPDLDGALIFANRDG